MSNQEVDLIPHITIKKLHQATSLSELIILKRKTHQNPNFSEEQKSYVEGVADTLIKFKHNILFSVTN